MSLNIIGTGSALPALTVTNTDLEAFLDTSDQWITTRTGIGSRHICREETLADLASQAAHQALDAAQTTPGDLDLILCATMQGDWLTPSLACMVQRELGAHCPAVDLNAACSGFLYALDMAESYIASGKAKNILIVCAEMMSKYLDWQDRSTCVLFGDGAGACVVAPGDGLDYIRLTAVGNSEPLRMGGRVASHPFGGEPAPLPPYLQMEGQEVFRFAVTTAGQEIRGALEALDLSADQVDFYLLHQANKRIIEAIRTRLGQPEEKFPTNIGDCGNCSSASVPLLLDRLVREGRIPSGSRLLITAFGAGMTSGTCVIRWKV